MADGDPDELLMAQVARGIGDALEPLVRRYAEPLVSFLNRMTGDRHRAEELFQDTFFTVWRKRGTYSFPRPFKPWLYAIALNTFRAAHRREKPVSTLPEQHDATSNEPLPPEHAMASEATTKINGIIQSMPAAMRAVVTMRVWDGLSYAEIAEAVGSSEATVRSHMSHGLAELRRAFA